MYFFGYGNFLSSTGTAGIGLARRLSINGGYAMGSRYTIRETPTTVWEFSSRKRVLSSESNFPCDPFPHGNFFTST
jgi:hypothetical protein